MGHGSVFGCGAGVARPRSLVGAAAATGVTAARPGRFRGRHGAGFRRRVRSKAQRRHRRNDGRLPDSRQASQVGRWTLRQPNSRRRRAVADPAAHAAADLVAYRVVGAMAPWEHARNQALAKDACRRRAHDPSLAYTRSCWMVYDAAPALRSGNGGDGTAPRFPAAAAHTHGHRRADTRAQRLPWPAPPADS